MHFQEDPKLEQLEGQLLRQLFVRTVAPVYCLLIKMFDQLKNSRHELIFISDVCWLFQNAVMFISGLILLGINKTNFFIWSQRDKCILFQPSDVQVGGGGGGGGCGSFDPSIFSQTIKYQHLTFSIAFCFFPSQAFCYKLISDGQLLQIR